MEVDGDEGEMGWRQREKEKEGERKRMKRGSR